MAARRWQLLFGPIGVLIALGFPALAQATFPGRNDRLLIAQNDASASRPLGLWSLSPRRGRVLSVLSPLGNSDCEGQVESAAFSADGKRIAYGASWFVGGSRPTECVSATPKPFPGSGSVAEVTVVNSDGRHPRRLVRTAGRDLDVAFSPDGGEVAVAGLSDQGIVIIDIAGGRRHTILKSSSPHSIAWGPTDEIAYDDDQGIYIARPDGTGARAITPPGGDTIDSEPNWSPNGTEIAFTRTITEVFCARDLPSTSARPADSGCSVEELSDIYVIGAQGGKPRRLTHNQDSAVPVWSPDGNWIAYTTGSVVNGTKVFDTEVDGTVTLIPSRGGHIKRLASNLGVALDWRPRPIPGIHLPLFTG